MCAGDCRSVKSQKNQRGKKNEDSLSISRCFSTTSVRGKASQNIRGEELLRGKEIRTQRTVVAQVSRIRTSFINPSKGARDSGGIKKNDNNNIREV